MSPASVRPALRAGYGLGLLLTVVPLVDLGLGLRPFHPLELGWRMAAFGQLGITLMLPLIGCFVLAGTAILLEDGQVLRAFALVAGVVVVLLSAALLGFVHDTLELRSALRPEELRSRSFAFPKVVLAYSTTIWVLLWLVVGVYRVWQRQSVAARRERESVLIVREATVRRTEGRAGAP